MPQGVCNAKNIPPVRLDAHSSIRTTPAFAKLAFARTCVCIAIACMQTSHWIATAQVKNISFLGGFLK
jgi:hypothetical protein